MLLPTPRDFSELRRSCTACSSVGGSSHGGRGAQPASDAAQQLMRLCVVAAPGGLGGFSHLA